MVDQYDEGAKIRRWRVNLESPTKVLEQIGEMMVSESQRAFKKQRFGRDRWKRRAPINVYGIIADFAAKGRRAPPARRFETRPALVDTGRLRGSIAKEVSGQTVTVGSNLPYAAVLHSGGPISSKKITPEVQKKLGKWLKGKGSKFKTALGWLLNKKWTNKKLEGEVDARPFVGLTKQTRADIKTLVGVHVMEVD